MIRVGDLVRITGGGEYLFTMRGKIAMVLGGRCRGFVRVYLQGEGWVETLLRSEVEPL